MAQPVGTIVSTTSSGRREGKSRGRERGRCNKEKVDRITFRAFKKPQNCAFPRSLIALQVPHFPDTARELAQQPAEGLPHLTV